MRTETPNGQHPFLFLRCCLPFASRRIRRSAWRNTPSARNLKYSEVRKVGASIIRCGRSRNSSFSDSLISSDSVTIFFPSFWLALESALYRFTSSCSCQTMLFFWFVSALFWPASRSRKLLYRWKRSAFGNGRIHTFSFRFHSSLLLLASPSTPLLFITSNLSFSLSFSIVAKVIQTTK